MLGNSPVYTFVEEEYETPKGRYLVTFRVAALDNIGPKPPVDTLADHGRLFGAIDWRAASHLSPYGEDHMPSVYLRAGIQKENEKAQVVRMKCPRLR
jgi:hypothetical protein